MQEIIKQVINSDVHSFIITGVKYSGKTELAYKIAKIFCCETKKDNCSCQSCRNFPNLDLLEVKPSEQTRSGKASRRKIIPISAILESKDIYHEYEEHVFEFAEKPPKYNHKVVLIHQAESLNEAAANSLLKLIEEPLNKTIFLFITEEINLLLPTIISRSVKIYCKSLKEDIKQEDFLKLSNYNQIIDFIDGRKGLLKYQNEINETITKLQDFIIYLNQNLYLALQMQQFFEDNIFSMEILRFLYKDKTFHEKILLDNAISQYEEAKENYCNLNLAFMNFVFALV